VAADGLAAANCAPSSATMTRATPPAGPFLRQYIEAPHATRSRPYRPILFVFDVKD
jgi:hypothetical protein